MKIPVFCSLLPTELITRLGHEPCFIDGGMLTLEQAEEYHCSFHENICSYSKTLFDYLLRNQDSFDLIVIPTACDALKKLFNALLSRLPGEKLYVLDVPKIKNRAAKEFFGVELGKLSERMGDINKEYSSSLSPSPLPSPQKGEGEGEGDRIGIVGANIPMNVVDKCLTKFGLKAACLNHCLTKAYSDDELLSVLKIEGLTAYAHAFLDKNSCPRTDDNDYKRALLDRIKDENIVGIVTNVLKFCDFQPFDFKYFKRELGPDFPVMMIEHDLTANNEGQFMTRLEAFFEGIRKKMGQKRCVAARNAGNYFAGIDSGSHATKMICVDKDRNIVSREVVPTGTSVKKSFEVLLDRLKEQHGIRTKDIARIIATGYGRNKIGIADDVVTEISCHALGAHHILGHSCTIIDIGGQDSKAIKIDGSGNVIQFAMNDKCAAGTGRFLEVMAAKLEMELDEFSDLAFSSKRSVAISSMCSVFAESEVISLIASGRSRAEIAKGIHKAIAGRTIALAKRIDGKPPYYMTGGVAQNRGLVKELEECLGSSIRVIEHPQFSGALGAALIAGRNNNDN